MLAMFCVHVHAHEVWSVDRCMRYAVAHSHGVRQQQLALDDNESDRMKAWGAFLPSVEAGVGGQFNFGRTIDPETNTYTNVNTFYNNYSLSASLPLFDGMRRYHALRLAKVNTLLGRQALRAKQDETAMQVYKAYVNVCYGRGALAIATDKRDESAELLRRTRLMERVGTKGGADVAQMEATLAADECEVTRCQNSLSNATLALKSAMNYPADSTLTLDTLGVKPIATPIANAADIYARAKAVNPTLRQAEYGVAAARQSLAIARGALLPTLSVGGGLGTTYFKNLHQSGGASLGDQLRNNMGKYVYATLSIPLFNRLATVSSIRRERNSLRKACERLDFERSELRRLVTEAWTDLQDAWAEQAKTRSMVVADSIAARVSVRKYEEGMASPLDVRATAVALARSRARYLQSQLNCMYRQRILNYYQGDALWTDL